MNEESNMLASVAVPPKRKWKKVLWIMGAVLAILVIFVWQYPRIMGMLTSDIGPIDDSDLALQIVSVPDAENSYFDLVKIPKLVGDIDILNKHTDGTIWNDQFVAQVLAQNADILTTFDEAAKKSKYQDPVSADPAKISPDNILPPLNSIRTAATLSAVKARVLAREGKGEEALAEAFKSVKIGQQMEGSQGSLIGYLVAMAMKNIGLKTAQSIISTTNIPPQILNHYASQLSSFQSDKDGFKKTIRAEYIILKSLVDLVSSPGGRELIIKANDDGLGVGEGIKYLNNNFYIRPNKTKELFSDITRFRETQIEKPCSILEKEGKEEFSLIKSYFTENAIGKNLANVVKSSLSSVPVKLCQENFNVAGTYLLFAMRLYQLENGSLPPSLDALVPKYAAVLPADPYTGQAFRYSPEKKIIYSIGIDMQDSGGATTSTTKSDAPDPTIKIEF